MVLFKLYLWSVSLHPRKTDVEARDFSRVRLHLEKLGVSDVDLIRIVSGSKQSDSLRTLQLYDQAKDSLGGIVLDDIPLLQSDDCQMGL